MKITLTKFKKFLSLSLCYLYFIFRGRANKKVISPKKILIIQTAKLGDMICTTPLFRAVKSIYPNTKVYVMGSAVNKEILENNHFVDGYLILNKSLFKNIRAIKKEHFDFSCLTSPDFKSLAAAFLSGIPLITTPLITKGECPNQTKIYYALINLVVVNKFFVGSYFPRQYLRLLEPIGIFTKDTKKSLSFSNEADKKIKHFLFKNDIKESNFIIIIFPSAGNKIKIWHAERFAQLIDYIYKKYKAKIIIIGGKNDQDEVEKTISFLNKKTSIINALEVFSIDELKALISKVGLFISADTGPIYIAEAFKIPTINIIGPINEREQAPFGKFNKNVIAPNRGSAALHVSNARFYNKEEAQKQIDNITTDIVIEKLDELISEIKASKQALK